MAETLHRVAAPALTIRSDGRTVTGLAVPFDTPTDIREGTSSYVEVFRRGAFRRTIEQAAHKVKLLANHDGRRLPLGAATLMREDDAGLYLEARVSQTRDGDEALELIRDGALDSLSVGFSPIRDREGFTTAGRIVERLEVRLREVSLVAFPAFEDARILAVRADGQPYGNHLSASEARHRLAQALRSTA